MIQTLTRLFPLWAVLFSVFAFLFPGGLAQLNWAIVPLLMLIMFGMGMTLTWADFADVARRPGVIGAGMLLQFLVMPLVALVVGQLLALPPELLLGLVIVGACPGGTASNVICYLARADVALSITMTSISTLVAVVATPLLVWVYQGQSIEVPVMSMLGSLVQIVLLPVIAGTLLNSLFHRPLEPVRAVFPLLSVAAIVLVIGVIVALNRDRIALVGAAVIAGGGAAQRPGAGAGLRRRPADASRPAPCPHAGDRSGDAEFRPGRGPGGEALLRRRRAARGAVQRLAQSVRVGAGLVLAAPATVKDGNAACRSAAGLAD